MGISAYRWYRAIVFGEHYISEPLLYFFARRIADIRRRIDDTGREAVKKNLRLFLGPDVSEAEIEPYVKKVYYQTAAYIHEFLGQKRFSKKWLMQQGWDCSGIELINKAQDSGKGVMILSAHFSNWEIGAALLATFGKEVYVTSLEHEDPRITELFNELRSVWGYHHMPIDKSVKLTMEALRNGKIACYLADRTLAAVGTVAVQFFGKRVHFPSTPAKMALKTGAAIIPGFVTREGRNFFHLKFYEEITPLDNVSIEDNVKYVMQKYAHSLEKVIRVDPSQWIRYTPIEDELDDTAEEDEE